jgi:hypothetical protein
MVHVPLTISIYIALVSSTFTITFTTYHWPAGCSTNYHNNFSVTNGIRTYYSGKYAIPDAIQVGEHQFMEREVLNLFVSLMKVSWYVPSVRSIHSKTSLSPCIHRLSATNGARVYNDCLAKVGDHNNKGPFSFELRSKHVWDGVILFCLLEDHERQEVALQLPHTSNQRNRLTCAIQEQNDQFERNGQLEWAHYCEKCDEDGNPIGE